MSFSEIASLRVADARLSKKGQKVLITLAPASRSITAQPAQLPSGSSAPAAALPGSSGFQCSACPATFQTKTEALTHEADNLYHVVVPVQGASYPGLPLY